MSTKSTLARGKTQNCDFHFYSEAWDDDHVHLDITVGDEHRHQFTYLSIPIAVWEVIRQKTIWKDDLIRQGDEQLGLRVQEFIQGRDRQVQTIVDAWVKKGMNPRMARERAKLAGIMGGANFGVASDPHKKQTRLGMAFLKKERARQEALNKEIGRLLLENANCPGVFVIDLKKRKKGK